MSNGRLVDEVDEDGRPVDRDPQPPRGQPLDERLAPVLDLDREGPGPLGERAERRRAKEAPALDRDEVVADPLDLAEQVGGDDHGDPEFGPGPPDELEHLVAAGRVEAVRRLVEEEQPRVATPLTLAADMQRHRFPGVDELLEDPPGGRCRGDGCHFNQPGAPSYKEF